MSDGSASSGAAPHVGTVLGRYVLVRLLGAGGMGAVYEGTHQELGKRVAIKLLQERYIASPAARQRFLLEGRAVARIRHPNVADVYDVGIEGTQPYLVMELLEGEDLARLLAREAPFSVQRAADLLIPVIAGVGAAHALGVVHRDLKPGNIFLARERHGIAPKVLDFGIAKLADSEASSAATETGTVMGTPHYMSPEQARGDTPIDAKADQYSLGVVLYQLVTGRLPLEGVPLYAVIHKTVQGDFPSPRQLVPALSSAFEELILRAMARQPERRFGTTADFGEALLGFASAGIRAQYGVELGGGRAPTISPVAPSGSASEFPETQSHRSITPAKVRAKRPLAWALAGLAVLSVVGAAVSWRYWSRRPAAPVCGLPGSASSEACGSCLAQACCEQAEQCAQTEGCPAVEQCRLGCASGDVQCRLRCIEGKATPAQIQTGLEMCRATRCAAQCLPGPWECAEKVHWHFPIVYPREITIKATALCGSCGAGGAPEPLPGVTVRVCSAADPRCDQPLASRTSDESGNVTIALNTAFNNKPPLVVFLEYGKEGYLHTLLNLNSPPLWGDRDVGPTFVLTPKDLSVFSGRFDATPDPARAHVVLYPEDCNLVPAPERVAVTWLDRDAQTLSKTFAEGGFVGATNLPVSRAGLTRVVVRASDTQQLIATTNLVLRAGALTVAHLPPSP
jgi:tRNA A-37 threonylcarbamoyl transferase component Bud32